MAESILRRYNFKLYPNRIQSAEMDTMRRMHCTLYNAALQQRIDAYRLAGVSLTHFTQARDIKTIRADDPAYAALAADSLSGTLKRLDLAYQAFYRRAKAGAGKESGFPKYKRSDDYPGFHHRSGHGWKLSFAPRARKGTMYVKGVTGPINLRGKFPGPPISVRTCDVKLHGGTWWASIAVELPARMRAEQQHSGEVSFDLVDHFARVRRVNGGHAAGPEDTVYAAADGRIFPVFERVIPHQAEASDEHQWSVGDMQIGAASNLAEASDEHQESVGGSELGMSIDEAGSSDETGGSVGIVREGWRTSQAESSDEHQESVGIAEAGCRYVAGSSDETVGSVGRMTVTNPHQTESSDERRESVGEQVGVLGHQPAEASDESGGSVVELCHDAAAGSSDESQGSVGVVLEKPCESWAGSSDESQGSVGNSVTVGRQAGAGSPDEHQESVGSLARFPCQHPAESSVETEGSVGSAHTGGLKLWAGSSVETEGSVGDAQQPAQPIEAESSDESQESVGRYVSPVVPAKAESPAESQETVGQCPGCNYIAAGSSDESQGSVGIVKRRMGNRATESSDETGGSVGAVADAQAGESVGRMQDPAGSSDETQKTVGQCPAERTQTGDINSGNLCMAAGSPPETQKTVGAGARRNSETVGSGRVASVKDLQRGMAKCKRGSRRYRYRRRIKAKREARVARQRRESLHVWSTTLVRRYASLVIIKPPLVEATQSGAGTEREPGAAVGLKAEVNRHVLDQAPGLAVSMLEYKLAERGGTAKIIETRAAPVLAGNLVVAATKANRKLKRTAKRA